MKRVLKTLGFMLLMSLSLVNASLQAQDAPAPQDPCWLLTNPPESPTDNSTRASLEQSALQMVASGETDTALELFTRIIDDNPDDADGYALRGCLYARVGNERKAISDWKDFVDLSEDDDQIAEVEKLIAIYSGDDMACYAGGGIYASQRAALDEINEYDPTKAKGEDHNQRGLAYLCLGYYELAIRDFAYALDTDKTSSIYYSNRGMAYIFLGDTEKAIRDYTKSLELEPGNAITFVNRADAYADLEDYGNALADLDAALEIDSSYELALSKRAKIYYLLSDPQRAIRDYTALIETSPTDVYYNNRGLAYLDLDMDEEARDDFLQAAELVPDSPIYWYNVGSAYVSLDDMENALDAFDRSIELDPNDPEALDWRAYIYFYIDEFGECIADYTVLFTMDSPLKDKPDNWMRRGVCYHSLGNYEQAVRDYDTALELDPDDAEVLAYRGAAYRNLEEYSDAMDDLTAAIDLDETYAYAWRERGLVYYDIDEYEEAIIDYNEALHLDPDHALTYFNRAYAYYYLKDYRHAKEDFETYLEMVPDAPRREEVEDLLKEMAEPES
jgi:tetratricopeptide (TPR) repeat protein